MILTQFIDNTTYTDTQNFRLIGKNAGSKIYHFATSTL